MKKVLLLISLLPLVAFAQPKDVVYLKNGSIIKGSIKELNPTESLKIETQDGSLFVYKMSEIEKLLKDEPNEKEKLLIKYAGFVDLSFGGKRSEELTNQFFDTFGKEIYSLFSFNISTTHGAYISKYFYLGAGVELDLTHLTLNLHYPDNTTEQIKVNSALLPVYANFRINPIGIKSKFSPFIDLRIGCESLSPAFFISPSIGVRFNINKFALNFAFCYELYQDKSSKLQDFEAKIGIEF